MRHCPTCSRAFDDTAQFCPRDGAPLRASAPLAGGILDGRYRLDALLGAGAMGAVYRATQLNLHRTVAIKFARGDLLSDPRAVERFRREALVVAQLKHPNIVTIHDFGVTPEAGAYLVMEHLEGRSLRQELERTARLDLGDALEVMRQACAAVGAAHAAGVIHRDLKPENIFLEATLDRSIAAKVLDFGIAKLTAASHTTWRRLTLAGAFLGTPVYTSPEQSSGDEVDARADIYSLGCILYEMLTGRPPFLAESLTALLLMQASK